MHVPTAIACLQLRRGWRSLIGIGPLVALVGGLVGVDVTVVGLRYRHSEVLRTE